MTVPGKTALAVLALALMVPTVLLFSRPTAPPTESATVTSGAMSLSCDPSCEVASGGSFTLTVNVDTLPPEAGDNDGDTVVDEDPEGDENGDTCPGVCGVDDDEDTLTDEGGADATNDDDEDFMEQPVLGNGLDEDPPLQAGYQGLQAWVQWPGFGLNYNPTEDPADEVTWPDCAFAARDYDDDNLGPDYVQIGCASFDFGTGLPVTSKHTGGVFTLDMACRTDGSHQLSLIVAADQTQFVGPPLPTKSSHRPDTLLPTVTNVTVTCGEAAPAEEVVTGPVATPTVPIGVRSEVEPIEVTPEATPTAAPAPEATPTVVTAAAPEALPPTGSGPSAGSTNALTAILASLAALAVAAGFLGLGWARRQQR